MTKIKDIEVYLIHSDDSDASEGRWVNAKLALDEVYNKMHASLNDANVHLELHGVRGSKDTSRLYSVAETFQKMLSFYREQGALATLLYEYCNRDMHKTLLTLEHNYHGVWDSEVDFISSLFNENYFSHLPEFISMFYDYIKCCQYLFNSEYFSLKAGGELHIFSSSTNGHKVIL